MKRTSETLDSWLVWATQDLAQREIGRIREEITAHFAEAAAQYQANGANRDEAYARALEDLGDPHRARAAFLRVCYTARDQERHERLMRRSWWAIPFGAGQFIISLMMTVWALLGGFDQARKNEAIGIAGIHWTVPDLQGVPIALLILGWFLLAALMTLELEVKVFLQHRFPKIAVLLIQIFVITLMSPALVYAVTTVVQTVKAFSAGQFTFAVSSGWVTLWLAWRWLRMQAPLTLKTLRQL